MGRLSGYVRARRGELSPRQRCFNCLSVRRDLRSSRCSASLDTKRSFFLGRFVGDFFLILTSASLSFSSFSDSRYTSWAHGALALSDFVPVWCSSHGSDKMIFPTNFNSDEENEDASRLSKLMRSIVHLDAAISFLVELVNGRDNFKFSLCLPRVRGRRKLQSDVVKTRE